jgi:hypothetical protein
MYQNEIYFVSIGIKETKYESHWNSILGFKIFSSICLYIYIATCLRYYFIGFEKISTHY